MKRSWCLLAAVLLAPVVIAPSAAPAKAKPKPPQIVKHRDVTAEATSPRGAVVVYLPAAVKNIQGVSGTSVTYSKKSGTLFPLGKTTVTILARNAAGVARSTFVVRVVDTTAPTFGATPDVAANAAAAEGVVVSYGPITATDVVDTSPTVGCTPKSGTLFKPGTTTVRCTARDDAGNTSTATFQVVVRANHAPAFPSPLSTTSETTFAYDALGRLTGATTTIAIPAATDADGDTLAYSWTASNGTIVGAGTTATWSRLLVGGRVQPGKVVVTATDPSGATATCTIDFR